MYRTNAAWNAGTIRRLAFRIVGMKKRSSDVILRFVNQWHSRKKISVKQTKKNPTNEQKKQVIKTSRDYPMEMKIKHRVRKCYDFFQSKFLLIKIKNFIQLQKTENVYAAKFNA